MIKELDLKDSHFRISAFKHDGFNYRNWSPVYQLESFQTYHLFYSPQWKTIVYERGNKTWKPKFSSLWVFPKTKFYNVLCILKDHAIYYYVNLCTPPRILNRRIGFIDYDIDYRYDIDGKLDIRDTDEFDMHIMEYGYSKKLVERIKKETQLVESDYKEKVFPFGNNEILTYLQKKEKEYNDEKSNK